jgi:hypothetical protein
MANTGCGDVKLLPLKESSSLTKMNNKLTLQATNILISQEMHTTTNCVPGDAHYNE